MQLRGSAAPRGGSRVEAEAAVTGLVAAGVEALLPHAAVWLHALARPPTHHDRVHGKLYYSPTLYRVHAHLSIPIHGWRFWAPRGEFVPGTLVHDDDAPAAENLHIRNPTVPVSRKSLTQQ